jgi:hypothetical protein
MASKRTQLVDQIIEYLRAAGKTEPQISEHVISLAPLTTDALQETIASLQNQTATFQDTLQGHQQEVARLQAEYQEAKEVAYFFQKHPQYGGSVAHTKMNEEIFRKALPGERLSVANMTACLQMPHVVSQLQVSDQGARRHKLIDGIIELLSKGNAADYLASERNRLSGETMPYLEERFQYLIGLKAIEYAANGQKRTPSEIRQVVKAGPAGVQLAPIPPELTRRAFAKCTPDEQRKNIRQFSADRLNEHWRIQEGRI